MPTHLALAVALALALPAPASLAADQSPPAPKAAAVTVPLVFPVLAPVRWDDTFGAPRGGGTRLHEGQDLPAPKMTRVVAVFDGTVTLGRSMGASGYYIRLAGDCGWTACYYHLNNDTPGTDDGKGTEETAFAPGLRTGDRVRAGQVIGFVGDSGNAEDSGAHLHFELRGSVGAINAAPSLRAARIAGPAELSPPAVSGLAATPAGAIDPPAEPAAEPPPAPAPPPAVQPPARVDAPLASRSSAAPRDEPGMQPAEAAEAQRLVDAVNAARRKAGLPDLAAEGRLRAVALRRARSLAAHGLRSAGAGETLSQRLAGVGYRGVWSTELVGVGFSRGADAAERWVLREGAGRLARNGRQIGVACALDSRTWVVVLADPAP